MFCEICLKRIEGKEKAFKNAKTGGYVCEECAKNFKLIPVRFGKFRKMKTKVEGIEIPCLIPC